MATDRSGHFTEGMLSVFSVFCFLCGTAVFGWQVFHWFNDGLWIKLSLLHSCQRLFGDIFIHDLEVRGGAYQFVYRCLNRLPTALSAVFLGWISYLLVQASSKQYKRKRLGRSRGDW